MISFPQAAISWYMLGQATMSPSCPDRFFGKGHKKGMLMSKIDSLVQDFLAQNKIAVVGVSDKRETGCNLSYRKLKGRDIPSTRSIRA